MIDWEGFSLMPVVILVLHYSKEYHISRDCMV